LEAIDGPHLGVHDDEVFRHQAAVAKSHGFDGKWAIHPAQLDALNEVFTASSAELDQARATLAAWREAGEAGAVALNGRMIDEAVVLRARRLLAMAADR
jgi:citrate lyase subunit beta/citryl-CoA lyase